MNEFNSNEHEYEQIVPPVINPNKENKPSKPKKNHYGLKLAVAFTVAFGGGYGGARYADRKSVV